MVLALLLFYIAHYILCVCVYVYIFSLSDYLNKKKKHSSNIIIIIIINLHKPYSKETNLCNINNE